MIVKALRQLLLATPTVQAWVDGRIYPRQLPDAPTYPAIVITKVAGNPEQDMAGGLKLERARVQVDVYTEGYDDGVTIKTLIRERLHGYSGPGLTPCGIQRSACTNDMDLSEAQAERAGPRTRRRMLEFDVWNTEG